MRNGLMTVRFQVGLLVGAPVRPDGCDEAEVVTSSGDVPREKRSSLDSAHSGACRRSERDCLRPTYELFGILESCGKQILESVVTRLRLRPTAAVMVAVCHGSVSIPVHPRSTHPRSTHSPYQALSDNIRYVMLWSQVQDHLAPCALAPPKSIPLGPLELLRGAAVFPTQLCPLSELMILLENPISAKRLKYLPHLSSPYHQAPTYSSDTEIASSTRSPSERQPRIASYLFAASHMVIGTCRF